MMLCRLPSLLLSMYYKTVRVNNSAVIALLPHLMKAAELCTQIASLLNITKGVKHEQFVTETIQQQAGLCFHNNTADPHLSL